VTRRVGEVTSESQRRVRRSVSAGELAYYRSDFRAARRDDGIVCLECGAIRRTLGGHVIEDGELLTLARAGTRCSLMAKRLGVAAITVTRRLRALRHAGLLAPVPGFVERARPILDLYEGGLWPSQIAARLGVKKSGVLKTLWKLRRRGVAVRRPERPRPSPRRRVGASEGPSGTDPRGNGLSSDPDARVDTVGRVRA